MLQRLDHPCYAVNSTVCVHCQLTVGVALRVSRHGINTNIVQYMYTGHTGYGRISPLLWLSNPYTQCSRCGVMVTVTLPVPSGAISVGIAYAITRVWGNAWTQLSYIATGTLYYVACEVAMLLLDHMGATRDVAHLKGGEL
jgi:hypothetical protein